MCCCLGMHCITQRTLSLGWRWPQAKAIAEKGQNNFCPQCLALCRSPRPSHQPWPLSSLHFPSSAVGHLVMELLSSFILPPFWLSTGALCSKETLANEHISSFPAPELSQPSSSFCHLMLPFALALFLLTLPLASGSAPCSPNTF